MHFVCSGAGRPPVVLVHGFAGSHADWQPQIEGLAPRREVIAVDLRGHGATPGRPQECTIEHYGGDLAALLSMLALPPAVLVGHSMGCRVVLEANRLAPDHVAGIVLVDGSRIGTGDPQAAEAGARAAIEASGYAAFARPFYEAMFLVPTPRSREIVEKAMRLPAPTGAALFARMVRWDAERMDEALAAVRAPLAAIQSTYINTERQRVALMPGETTPWLELLKARVPGARIEVIPGVGHFTQLEAPERVNAIVEAIAARK